MIPNTIEIVSIKDIEGELKEVPKQYHYEFNFNSGNAFRKSEGLTYNEYIDKFSESKDEFELSEGVGKLFYYALKEGERIVGRELDLSLEDVLRWVNNEAENYAAVLGGFNDSHPQVEEGDKKKAESN